MRAMRTLRAVAETRHPSISRIERTDVAYDPFHMSHVLLGDNR